MEKTPCYAVGATQTTEVAVAADSNGTVTAADEECVPLKINGREDGRQKSTKETE
jgi:hypothetical protein